MPENPFVAHLRALAQRDDRAALAALRRGLGRPPGSAPEMHPIVAPWLPDAAWTWRNQCCYITAALLASHPSFAASGNLGDTHRAVAGATQSESVEKRFAALLKCHRDDLFDHLRQAVSLARGKDVPVCYEQLHADILSWDHPDGFVQRNWAWAFWGGRQDNTTQTIIEGSRT